MKELKTATFSWVLQSLAWGVVYFMFSPTNYYGSKDLGTIITGVFFINIIWLMGAFINFLVGSFIFHANKDHESKLIYKVVKDLSIPIPKDWDEENAIGLYNKILDTDSVSAEAKSFIEQVLVVYYFLRRSGKLVEAARYNRLHTLALRRLI